VSVLGVGFLGGCTQKNPPGSFGYVPWCLNPANQGHFMANYQLNVLLIY